MANALNLETRVRLTRRPGLSGTATVSLTVPHAIGVPYKHRCARVAREADTESKSYRFSPCLTGITSRGAGRGRPPHDIKMPGRMIPLPAGRVILRAGHAPASPTARRMDCVRGGTGPSSATAPEHVLNIWRLEESTNSDTEGARARQARSVYGQRLRNAVGAGLSYRGVQMPVNVPVIVTVPASVVNNVWSGIEHVTVSSMGASLLTIA
jgi:hypothetical protein